MPCSLFGEDVQLLLDMDRANSPGCIMVSDAALNLISNRSGQFTPVCKVMCNGQGVQMHAWTPEVSWRCTTHQSGLNQSSLNASNIQAQMHLSFALSHSWSSKLKLVLLLEA